MSIQELKLCISPTAVTVSIVMNSGRQPFSTILSMGRSKSRTVKALGYPTRQQLTEWLKQDLPDEVHPCAKGQSLVPLSKEQKEQVAIELCTRDGSAQEIADKYNVSRYSVYNWAWNLLKERKCILHTWEKA